MGIILQNQSLYELQQVLDEVDAREAMTTHPSFMTKI